MMAHSLDVMLEEDRQPLADLVRRVTKASSGSGGLCVRDTRDWWGSMAEAGLLSIMAPANLGGIGGNFLDVGTVMKELGRAFAGGHYLAHIVICGGLLESEPELLASIGMGDRFVALAHEESGEQRVLATPTLVGAGQVERYGLTGSKFGVLGGGLADTFLVTALHRSSSAKADSESLFLVSVDQPGVVVNSYQGNDLTAMADLHLKDAYGRMVLHSDLAGPLIERALESACAASCAEAAGALDALVEISSEYARTREQFGVPIGSFQAVQHKLSEMLIASEHVGSLAQAACWSVDNADWQTRQFITSAAKIGVNRASRLVANHAVQIHGGMGMVEQSAVSRYFRMLAGIRLRYGTSVFHLERMARLDRERLLETPYMYPGSGQLRGTVK